MFQILAKPYALLTIIDKKVKWLQFHPQVRCCIDVNNVGKRFAKNEIWKHRKQYTQVESYLNVWSVAKYLVLYEVQTYMKELRLVRSPLSASNATMR